MKYILKLQYGFGTMAYNFIKSMGPPRRRRKFKTLGSFSFGIVETYFPYTVTWLVKQEKLCRHHSSCVAGMAVQRYPTFLKNRLLLFLGW